MPASIGIFFGALADFVSFDIIPNTDEIYDAVFGFPKTEPINHNYKVVGYDSVYMLKGIGSLLIFYTMIPFLVGTSLLMSKFK